MTLPSFPKIFHVGDKIIDRLFDGPVEITEKIDGSAFTFGKINDELLMRSKNAPVIEGDGNKMFNKAREVVQSIAGKLLPGFVYHGEYLQSPRHNTLAYERIPANHIMLYAIRNAHGDYLSHNDIAVYASRMDMEAVPRLAYVYLPESPEARLEALQTLMDATSVLGGPKMEGIVVKNYNQDLLIGGSHYRIMCGKYVSEAFKEKHKVSWSANNPSKQELLGEALKSKARWVKAIMRRKEANEFLGKPQDIGPLVKAIREDIVTEEKEWIKEKLWQIHEQEIMRVALSGFPDWYKESLVLGKFKLDDNKFLEV